MQRSHLNKKSIILCAFLFSIAIPSLIAHEVTLISVLHKTTLKLRFIFLMTGIRNAMGNFIDLAYVQRFIVFALVLNAATLGMDTSLEIMAK